jgi:hypothetical protein
MRTISELKEWHAQVLDFVILNPRATYEDIARKFNCGAVTVASIVRSDIFQARLAERRAVTEDAINDQVVARLRTLTHTSLDVLNDRIEKNGDVIPIADIRETAEMALRSLGYATQGRVGNTPPSQAPQVQVVVVGRDDLAEARALMRKRVGVRDELPALPATG